MSYQDLTLDPDTLVTETLYDDHDDDESNGCTAESHGWYCTRSAGHADLHEAVAGGFGLPEIVCARWSDD